MTERIFYCMKYHKLVNEKELKKCLARFTYYNKEGKKITGICPRLYDLLENKPYYKLSLATMENYHDNNKTSDNEGSDYWARKNHEYLLMLRRIRNLDPKRDIFKES